MQSSPDRVLLGFKAFDLHELFPHFVALELGAYREQGLRVELRDITFLGEEQWPPNLFSTACGGALCSALGGGEQRLLLAASRGPMFWLAGAPGTTWSDLKGSRIAGFPALAPPHLFLRIVLRERGLDPDRDVLLEPVRDDVARLGLLRENQVGAALLSSVVLPSDLKREGFAILSFLADHLTLPTSGLSSPDRQRDRQSEIRGRLIEAHRRALTAITDNHPCALATQKKWLPSIRPRFAQWMRSLYHPRGSVDPELVQPSLDRLAAEMRVGRRPARDLFR